MLKSTAASLELKSPLLKGSKKITVDEAFEQVGGFGIFQGLMTLSMTLNKCAAVWFLAGFGMYTSDLNYECFSDGIWSKCDKQTICSNPNSFTIRIDETHPDFIKGWQQEMNLMCTDRSVIQWMVIPYFIMTGFSGLLFRHLPDKWGPFKTLNIFMTVIVVALTSCLLVPNYWVRMMSFCVVGLCNVKNSATYMYMAGCVHQRDKSVCYGIINAYDCGSCLVIGLFYLFISRDYFPLMQIHIGLTFLSIIIVNMMQVDSPRWLVATG
jgi:hypothetical protein